MYTSNSSMSYQFWLILTMENVKFKEKRRELKTKSDKTIQTVTVSVQSAFRWLSHRPWAVCATGQLLHRWLAAAPGVSQTLLRLLTQKHLSWYPTANDNIKYFYVAKSFGNISAKYHQNRFRIAQTRSGWNFLKHSVYEFKIFSHGQGRWCVWRRVCTEENVFGVDELVLNLEGQPQPQIHIQHAQ